MKSKGHWVEASSMRLPRGISSMDGTKAFPGSGRCMEVASRHIIDPVGFHVGSKVKDRSRPDGSSGSENELSVCELWLS